MLSSSVNRRNAGRWAPVALAGLMLVACSTQQSYRPQADISAPVTQGSAYYLQQLQRSTDDNRSDWQILAIRALLSEGNDDKAGNLLQQLPANLSVAQQQEASLLSAQYQLHRHQTSQARQTLNTLQGATLSESQQSRFYSLVIASAGEEVNLSLLRAYVWQQNRLQGEALQKNIDATWQALLKVPPAPVFQFNINADEHILQGWLDLLGTFYQERGDNQALNAAVQAWRTRYPNNPAAKSLPAGLQQILNAPTASTGTIALLLPLSGAGEVFSKVIAQGFQDAHDDRLTPQPAAAESGASGSSSTETEEHSGAASQSTAPAVSALASRGVSDSTAQIKIYDTNAQPIAQLLQQVQQDGATLIVGPLLKSDVEAVANTPLSLNVLALNEPTQPKNQPNICYFALSPENEARDAANHLWAQGKRSPLLLVPESSLGKRITLAFAQQWQELGGGGVLQQQLGSSAELKQQINNSRGISLSGTQVTLTPAPASLGVADANLAVQQPQPDTDSHSGAVDAIYIVANQSDLDLIKPMITLRTGSRSNIALYASSLSSQAGAGPDFRLEMEGLQYSDIPLLSGKDPALMQQVVQRFNNDYTLSRLYAMGADAWILANHFSEFRQQPGYHLSGQTGELSANKNCVINRKLSWNQYIQGEVSPVN